MEKSLGYIDIAQEDGAQNPAAAHSRVKAKTDGLIVSRSPAGVEVALGGSLSVVSLRVPSDTGSTTFGPIAGMTVTIPPGKSATITMCGFFVVDATANILQVGFSVNNPSGANGIVLGSASFKVGAANTTNPPAAATSFYGGSTVNVAANTTSPFSVTNNTATTTGSRAGAFWKLNLINLSTNTSATVTLATRTAANGVLTNTSMFAIIS